MNSTVFFLIKLCFSSCVCGVHVSMGAADVCSMCVSANVCAGANTSVCAYVQVTRWWGKIPSIILPPYHLSLGLSIELGLTSHLALGIPYLSLPNLGLINTILIWVIRIQILALLLAWQVFELQNHLLSLHIYFLSRIQGNRFP